MKYAHVLSEEFHRESTFIIIIESITFIFTIPEEEGNTDTDVSDEDAKE